MSNQGITQHHQSPSSPTGRRALHLRLLDGGGLESHELCPGAGPCSVEGAEVVDWPAMASWGGTALGMVLLHGWPEAQPPLVLAVGDAVRRGLPTAQRTAIMGRSPLSGRLALGHVGGELASRLVSVWDAVAISGRTRVPGAVLVINPDGKPGLLSVPELTGLSPAATGRQLEEIFGPCASLRVGPAGEAGLIGANLCTGGEAGSFVGRGGLGARFGGLGLKALVVLAGGPAMGMAAGESAAAGGDDYGGPGNNLALALKASPRLRARADGGTLELFQAYGARGDLRGAGYAEPVSGAVVNRLVNEVEAAGGERRGQRGCHRCPTPCGWTFETRGGRTTAHFSALYALGLNVGEEHLDGALRLLAVCDEMGLDAKSTGASLALLADGDGEAMERLVRAAVAGSGEEEARLLAAGPAATAQALGLEGEAHLVRGQAGRPEGNLASVLGQCVAVGGVDPMRSFPFLATDGPAGGPDGGGVLVLEGGGGVLGGGELDPTRPEGKGRLVWWHENLVSALDMVGFCAFSGAGLLADRAATLDTLAGWILPAALGGEVAGPWQGVGPARRLLAAGASVVLLGRLLDRRWGHSEAEARPAWAAHLLDQPGMLDEYRALRRWGGAGPERGLSADLGTEGVLGGALAGPGGVAERWGAPPVGEARQGSVRLRATGILGLALGRDTRVAALLPVTATGFLREIAASRPAAASLLLRAGQPLPAIYRAGRRLGPSSPIETGDTLDLVLAVSGG
ncbi:MAG TPA: aldehyde ferredoxin oxidoreductase N-terminal domain-containing protein [Planctomycetota bacterium]|nr:aldehyde ferredoxin oxidoreductase N-terminal domain-containing protein [Planctomycetota bacterium]